MAACAVLVAGFEGVKTTPYHDTLAHGLPTVCAGETENVKMTDHYTYQQCLDMLAAKLPRYWDEIDQHITVLLSDNEKIAYTSFAYNLGSGAFIRSAFLKKLNEGHHVEACDGMLAYTRSMQVVRPGLVKRRKKEDAICQTIDLAGPVQVLIPLKASVPPQAPKKPSAPPLVCTTFLIWRTCK
jgi:lysozyme